VFQTSITPRELHILSPRSQEYFRRTREAVLGRRLEDLLLEPEKEDELWRGMDDKIRAVSELIRENRDKGPFVLGDRISYTDFFIAGALQAARVVDEGVFQRIVAYEGFKAVYEVCLTYMEKKD
jgi:glutathione S-transferase